MKSAAEKKTIHDNDPVDRVNRVASQASIVEHNPTIILAPLRGITDALFRQLLQKHFGGLDSALAPFINPQQKAPFDDRLLRDVLPEANRSLGITPQILHTEAEGFLTLARRLTDLGYQEINWNLGCPAPMVTRKKRGSGLLPYPDEILAFLDQVIPRLQVRLSIKTRLGLEQNTELQDLLPRLDDYPLTGITIHARLGRQLYKGQCDLETFERCLALSRHPITYNGDITSRAIFHDMHQRFPGIQSWMIGRGLISNPFLAQEIRGTKLTPDERHEQLHNFHQALYTSYKERLAGPSHLLGRMKLIWSYLAMSFANREKVFKRIRKANTEEQYLAVVEDVFIENLIGA
ncbi:MAG: tRNA-dihydrouridine synthase family protein [Desulfobulbaceae bacterium]|uniref:tRNA-dihydrouridine synthase n=1 Tax=Candidatus Desulfatifera sulfidica TaxID=2841691 RepID=A0A8J6T975_9BACT|nr:tRNA-dihydrouridine synthase family protein [Candidatus Desulfatifera sulfidica]